MTKTDNGDIKQVFLSHKNIDDVEFIKATLKSSSHGMALRQAVTFAADLIRDIQSGNKVLVEKRNGDVDRVELVVNRR